MENNKVLSQNQIKNLIKSNRVLPQTLIIPDEEIDCDFVNMIVTKNIGLYEENIASNQNKRSPILPENKVRNQINPKKILSKNLKIPDAGNHLYKFGLTNYYIGNNEIKRSLIHNPMLVFIMALIEILISIISLCNTNENMDLFYYLGNWVAFIPGVRIHGNMTLALYFSISLISQILHYWYSRKGISYEWIKPFEMMAGIKTPKQIGINNCFSKLVILFSKFFLLCI